MWHPLPTLLVAFQRSSNRMRNVCGIALRSSAVSRQRYIVVYRALFIECASRPQLQITVTENGLGCDCSLYTIDENNKVCVKARQLHKVVPSKPPKEHLPRRYAAPRATRFLLGRQPRRCRQHVYHHVRVYLLVHNGRHAVSLPVHLYIVLASLVNHDVFIWNTN